jgi:transcriptional regulator with XRE-family HTH domain
MNRTQNVNARDADRRLGRTLAWYRARAAMSQAEAARRLGVVQSLIAKIETGQRRALFREVVEIARLYRVSLAELAATMQSGRSDTGTTAR